MIRLPIIGSLIRFETKINQTLYYKKQKIMNPHFINYIDIETVTIVKNVHELPERKYELWKNICEKNNWLKEYTDSELNELWDQKGSFHPEFSKICCISVGFYMLGNQAPEFTTKTFYGIAEDVMLQRFVSFMNTMKSTSTLIAHFGKGFDYPFIIKRLIINNIPIPTIFDIVGKKPWETNLLDTHEIWKFTGSQSASLDLIAASLDMDSPKSEIDGSQVKSLYYDNKLQDIAKYCSNDVRCLAMVVNRILKSGTKITKIDYV